MSDFVLVLAIDFGTTYSGYAFSFKSEVDNIIMNKNWGDHLGLSPFKSHTSVLTKPNGEYVAFGFAAEEKYAENVENDEKEEQYLLFRHFKMILKKRGTLSSSTMLTAVDGKGQVQAMRIVTHVLKYMRDHAFEAMAKANGSNPPNDMVRWVVTVPAIRSEESKQFMREAAHMAGLISTEDSPHLVIALEPEAASLCCRRMDIARYPTRQDIRLIPGTKYLVIDNGGGTTDITAHEVLQGGSIREMHSASGGAWSGTKVDANFVQLLKQILGDRFIDEFMRRFPLQWLQFMRQFEHVKKSINPTDCRTLDIPLSYSMNMQYGEILGEGFSIQDACKKASKPGVGFSSGALRISDSNALALIEPVVQSIIDHVEDLLEKPDLRDCKLFFLVGGFSECAVLQSMFKQKFEKRVQILIPAEAHLAVIKGAVLFGHN